MTTSGPLPQKKEVILALLERSTVFIHLDPRGDDVGVPKWFKDQAQLVLQIGLNMPVPIRDLLIDDEAVSCTLSFNRSPFPCFLPWKAIYALVGEDGRGMVWPEDVPAEVAAQAQKQPKQEKEKKRPKLRAVPSEGDEAPEAAPEADAADEAVAEATETPPQERARPKLAAVPAPSEEQADVAEENASAAASDHSTDADEPKDGEVPEDHSSAESPPADSKPDADDGTEADGSGGKKLPPYLRVVK